MVAFAEYTWLIFLGGIVMIGMSFTIGANDVANTFGTSVGSKAITLPMACFLASIFETSGALFLGASVSSTLQNDVIDFTQYEDEEVMLMYGMICALVGGMIWLFTATMVGMPVSTTHAIIGGLIGFAVATNHLSAIHWTFLGIIAISWISSPIIAALASTLIYICFRNFILRSNNPVERGLKTLWIFVVIICITFSIFVMFGNPVSFNFSCKQLLDSKIVDQTPCILQYWSAGHVGLAILLVCGISFVIGSVLTFAMYKYAHYTIKQFDETELKTMVESETIRDEEIKPLFSHAFVYSESLSSEESLRLQGESKHSKLNFKTFLPFYDASLIELAQKEDPSTKALYEYGEIFDDRTESFVGAVQILSACFASLAHGANDVSNAVGPFAILYSVYTNGVLKKMVIPQWLLLICGLSISLGLACIGYKVIKTIGVRMIKMTPSRGVSIETATAFVVVFFSKFGIPLSTTYCQVGSTVGVGMAEPRNSDARGFKWLIGNAVNFRLFSEIFLAWILTVFFSAFVSAFCFIVGWIFTVI